LCILILIGLTLSQVTEYRLLEFNETTREWKPMSFIDEHLAECGKNGKHGGFIDVTDYPNLNPGGQKNQKVSFPDQPKHEALVNSLIELASAESLKTLNNMLTRYSTRYYTAAAGKQAAEEIFNTFVKYAGGRKDITVSFFPHTWLQPSVVARIVGSGPNKDEVVVIGAHEDSVNSRPGNAPGADDDASGTSTVLEVFRVLAEQNFVPSRTLEFHTYSAEEVGLRGSMAIANDYQKKGVNVVAMNQFDMTMYPGNAGKVGVVNDFVDSDLTKFLRMIIKTYSDLGIIETRCGYGCSDHASWTKAGFSASFPFESDFSRSNPKIHSTQDLLTFLNPNHGLEFVKMGLGFAVELSL